MARSLPRGFKDGIDIDAVDGAVQLLYDIPAIQIEYVRHEEPVLNTGFWRGVGVTHNNFVVESFIDELAAVSKQDPVAFHCPAAAGVALPFSTATGAPTWRRWPKWK